MRDRRLPNSRRRDASGKPVADDRGSLSIEMSIMMGVTVLTFLMLTVHAGRVSRQQADVQSAAQAAARAGSLQSWPNALGAAQLAAQENLATSGTACENGATITLASSLAEFETKSVGTGFSPGFIAMNVSCTTKTITLGSRNFTITSDYTAVEVVDTYRQEG